MKYTSQRGTRDILPSETPTWQFLEAKAREIFGIYNYSEIRTPLFEQTELFTRSIGQGTDIVGKEMYTFEDKGGRSVTLRPEETAPVVRAAIENNLFGQGEMLKLYYIGPMFRYERPQAGRYRQFHQAGIEVFGSSDPLVDVEVIEVGLRYFNEIGLNDLEVDINSVGCDKCRPGYKDALKKYLKDLSSKMCETCVGRIKANTLRVLDCKEGKCQKIISEAPASIDYLCGDCKEHFSSVKKLMDELGMKYKSNNKLVRGLDYYNRTTFEIISRSLGAQNAVCGGGRYDRLVEELGGKFTPAVGFAIGLDRLVMVLDEQKIKPSEEQRLQVFIAALGEEGKLKGYEVLRNLRNMNIKADMDLQGRSLNSQMKKADKMKAKFVIIIGDDELKNGLAVIKSMDNKTQEQIEFGKILERIKI